MRIFTNANYNFIKWRWHALIASLVIIWLGVGTIFLRGGIPRGIEFSGGTVVVLGFDHPVSEDAMRSALGPLGKDAVVQSYGQDTARHDMMVRLPQTAQQEMNLDEGATKV